LACPALRHRVKLTYEAIMRGRAPDEVISALIEEQRGRLNGGRQVKAEKTENAEKRLFRRS
ncbi:MAG: hypothetical protein IKX19_05090, partial [Clostridia bacterium]|nr:hypothetical protein [Clostridia bacterium]